MNLLSTIDLAFFVPRSRLQIFKFKDEATCGSVRVSDKNRMKLLIVGFTLERIRYTRHDVMGENSHGGWCGRAIVGLIIYFENIPFFHAKLGLDVFPKSSPSTYL